MIKPMRLPARLQDLISIIALSLGSSGCLVSMNLPQTRFESPEARGKSFHGEAMGSFQQVPSLTLVPNDAATPPVTDRPRISSSKPTIGAKVGLSLIKPLDFYARVAGSAPLSLGLKYQVLGEPSINAPKGNWSLSFILGGGFYREKEGTSTAGISHQFWQYGWETGAIGGYRVTEWFLPYAALYFSQNWVKGYVKQSANEYPFGSRGLLTSLNLGVETRASYFLGKLEIAQSLSNWGSRNAAHFEIGTALGIGW